MHETAPENTLAAVDRALRQGADGAEIDVRLTADGVPVCHHDAGLHRTSGEPGHVASTPYRDLPRIAGHAIPRLSEVVDLVAGRGRLVVEVKTPHWPAEAVLGTVDAVVGVLRRHRLEHVTVSSFDRHLVREVRRSGVPVRTALLGRSGLPLGVLLRRALRDGHPEAHPHVSSLLSQPGLLPAAHQQGVELLGWTVNAAQDLLRLAAAGLPGVLCDDPRTARDVLEAGALAPTG